MAKRITDPNEAAFLVVPATTDKPDELPKNFGSRLRSVLHAYAPCRS
jgi:hypothetical protein